MLKAALLIAALTGDLGRWSDYADAVKQWERGRPMIVVLSAEWCGPCRTLKAEIERIPGRHVAVKLDIERDEMAKRFPRVESLPTTYVFRRGRATERIIGANIERVKELLRE